jgi:MoaA/NifB/PqqE/SkfB family radical SAM enzyme
MQLLGRNVLVNGNVMLVQYNDQDIDNLNEMCSISGYNDTFTESDVIDYAEGVFEQYADLVEHDVKLEIPGKKEYRNGCLFKIIY